MSAEKQLSVRSTEAAKIAAALARDLGRPQKEVVLEALRELQAKHNETKQTKPPRKAASFARFEETLRRVHEEVRRIEAETGEKLTSNHDFLYDEFGLPK